jgi:uncharacterized Tic20 family protein
MNPADERTWATVIHLSGLVVGFWGALIGYLVLRERGPFIRAHTAEALNFQISYAIYVLGSLIVLIIPILLTFGVLAVVYVAVGIAATVFTIIAAVAAYRGEWYRYPLTIRFVK